MHVIHFFDLPVYRIAEDKYHAWLEEQYKANVAYATFNGVAPDVSICDSIRTHNFERNGAWRYNEIIAYIRLHKLGNQIRGEYYTAEKKRTLKSRSKLFKYETWKLAPELTIHSLHSATNADIFSDIVEYVSRCRSELKKGRVIDDAELMRIGPHVDWRGLFQLQP